VITYFITDSKCIVAVAYLCYLILYLLRFFSHLDTVCLYGYLWGNHVMFVFCVFDMKSMLD